MVICQKNITNSDFGTAGLLSKKNFNTMNFPAKDWPALNIKAVSLKSGTWSVNHIN